MKTSTHVVYRIGHHDYFHSRRSAKVAWKAYLGKEWLAIVGKPKITPVHW